MSASRYDGPQFMDWMNAPCVVIEPAVVPQIIETPMPCCTPKSIVAALVPPSVSIMFAPPVVSTPCVVQKPQPIHVSLAPAVTACARHSTVNSMYQGRFVVAPDEN